MADESSGPEIKVKYVVDLSDLKTGSAEAKKEVASIVPEVQKATTEGEKMAKSLEEVKKEATAVAPAVQKTKNEVAALAPAEQKAATEGQKVAKSLQEVKTEATAAAPAIHSVTEEQKKAAVAIDKSSGSTKGWGEMLGKASAIAGGSFVTSALAMATAIASANEEVKALDKSVLISSGSQGAYTESMSNLDNIADKYKTSIFSLAASFNELTRETRGTANEGKPTAEIFDILTSVSKKMGVSVDDTTGSFTSFIDKMKEGTVDSSGLANEMDKRLYEAFTKVAESMGVTNEELNKVLKTSDEAVSSVLPSLARELSKAMGDIPQQDAGDLGKSIEYAAGKATLLLDALFSTSGTKSFLAQAAEDAGGLMNQLTLLAKERGVTSVVLGLMDAGAETLLNGTGFEGPTLSYARNKIDTKTQKQALSSNVKYDNGASIGWNKQTSQFKLPSQLTKEDFNIAAAAEENRLKEEEKANKKRIAEAKRQASERKSALDVITRQEIEESKQRIRDGILAVNAAMDEAYGKHNGILGPIKQLNKTGISTGLDNNLKRTQEFSNPTIGDGSATSFDHIIAGIDGVIEKTKSKYSQMQNAISDEMVAATEQLNENIKNSLVNFGTDFVVGIGTKIGEALATGGESLENAGKSFGLMLAGLLQDLGKALIAAGMLKLAASKVFAVPAVGIAVGLAAVAAGAYLQTKMNESGQGLWTGGIVQGNGGIDTVPTRLTPGEAVLTQSHQGKLMSWLNGTYSGRDLMTNDSFGPGGRGGGGNSYVGRLTAELKSSTLAFAVDIGQEDNAYFR
jgi:hypothetical protein